MVTEPKSSKNASSGRGAEVTVRQAFTRSCRSSRQIRDSTGFEGFLTWLSRSENTS
jgi:hypothetical protein